MPIGGWRDPSDTISDARLQRAHDHVQALDRLPALGNPALGVIKTRLLSVTKLLIFLQDCLLVGARDRHEYRTIPNPPAEPA